MRKGRNNPPTLETILRKHAGHRTVLGVVLPILNDTIGAISRGDTNDGLTYREIEQGFKALSERYLRCDFHPTYIHRRLGPSGFLETTQECYRFKRHLLVGVTCEQLAILYEDLEQSLKAVHEDRLRLIAELEAVNLLPAASVQERHQVVDRFLSTVDGNRGENFEVISYAVLQEYFRSFGFELKRFSTIHANDGGMDFVASNAIYQVTVDDSIEKVKRDLRKCPGTKRVFVRPTIPAQFDLADEDEVLEVLELRDLLDHFLFWLLTRDQRRPQAEHLKTVIRVALDEFRRESLAEVGT